MATKTQKLTDERLAQLADAVLELAGRLDLRGLQGLVQLTGTEVAVIREIHRHPRIAPSRIADATGLQRSNVSAAIRTLEARGLVRRETVAGDARAVELVPTALADESVARIQTFWVQQLRQAPDSLLREGLAALETINALTAAIGAAGRDAGEA